MTTLRNELRTKFVEIIELYGIQSSVEIDLPSILADEALSISGIKSAEQRRKEALARKEEQQRKRDQAGGILGGMLAFSEKAEQIKRMQDRVYKALKLNADGPRFEGMIKFLMEKDASGETVEIYGAWMQANKFSAPKPHQISQRPDIVRETWPAAFAKYETQEEGYHAL